MDHIANFLKFISSAQSIWFLLDTSYNHGCRLASRFRLDPEEYEALLIVAGQAHYTRFGFALKPTAWSKFLGLGGRGDENITINHGCGGGDCGGSGNSDGNSDGGGCPRKFHSTARFDRVMGDVAYDRRHRNRARG